MIGAKQLAIGTKDVILWSDPPCEGLGHTGRHTGGRTGDKKDRFQESLPLWENTGRTGQRCKTDVLLFEFVNEQHKGSHRRPLQFKFQM